MQLLPNNIRLFTLSNSTFKVCNDDLTVPGPELRCMRRCYIKYALALDMLIVKQWTLFNRLVLAPIHIMHTG